MLQLIETKTNLLEKKKEYKSKTSQNLLMNNSGIQVLRKNETYSVWSKQSDKDNFQSLKETQSYKEKIYFKDSLNKSNLETFQTEVNSEFQNNFPCHYLIEKDSLKHHYLIDSCKKTANKEVNNFSFFDLNYPNTSQTFISKNLEEDMDNEMKSKREKNNDIFTDIEKEMEGLLSDLNKNQIVNDIKAKLPVWYKSMEKRSDFKLILDTKIGKYITLFKEFCNKEINKNQIYNQILKEIQNCEQKIYNQIELNFFGQQKKINLIKLPCLNNFNQDASILDSFKSSIENNFGEKLFKKDSYSLAKDSTKNTSMPLQSIKKESFTMKKKNNWKIKNKVSIYIRRTIVERLNNAIYYSQLDHFVSRDQCKKMAQIFEKLIGKNATSLIQYQKFILSFIKDIKKQKNILVQQLLCRNNFNNLLSENFENVIEEMLENYN